MTKKERIAELKRVHREYLHKTREMGYKCSLEEYLVDNGYIKGQDLAKDIIGLIDSDITMFDNGTKNLTDLKKRSMIWAIKCTVGKSEFERLKGILLILLKEWGIDTNGLRN